VLAYPFAATSRYVGIGRPCHLTRTAGSHGGCALVRRLRWARRVLLLSIVCGPALPRERSARVPATRAAWEVRSTGTWVVSTRSPASRADRLHTWCLHDQGADATAGPKEISFLVFETPNLTVKKQFADAGITSEPKTYADLLVAAEKLKAKGIQSFVTGGVHDNLGVFFAGLAGTEGGLRLHAPRDAARVLACGPPLVKLVPR
jgi:hypothetical protein